MEEIRLDELLAKPDVPLVDHLRDVLFLGNDLARRMGLDERQRAQALLACALHDIGKATTSFQQFMRAAWDLEKAKARGAQESELEELRGILARKKKAAYPHALASLPFVYAAEKHLVQRYGEHPNRLTATAAVLTHHSPLGPTLYQGFREPDYIPTLLPVVEAVWELLAAVGVGPFPPPHQFLTNLSRVLKHSPSAILHAAFSFGDGKRSSLLGLLQRLPTDEFAAVKTVLHLSDWWVSARGSQTSVFFLADGDRRVATRVSSLSLRHFQRQAATAKGDVLWLRAPTGTGKTEALLLWTGNAERLLYLLPTQATVNAMWRRLQTVYGEEQVGLAHGRAAYMLRRELDQDSLDARLFGSVFAKPVTVATLDQYLLAHLQGHHWEERRTLARQATVVLDEVHTYEPYTLGMLLAAIERERPARLALASATLPPSLLALFPKGSLVEAEPALWQRSRHRISLLDAPFECCLDECIAAASSGRRVLVVANTVRQAQQVYSALKGVLKPDAVHLLHSRFIFKDREEKEEKVAKAPPGTVFVATQVIEVSLNISYDVLFTELAPIDALIQRMGRVNRFHEVPSAPVHIFCRPSEGAQRIYGRDVLQWSLDLLRALPPMPTDADLAQATHRLYEKVISSPEWQKDVQAGRDTLHEVQDILGCYTIDLSDVEMQQRFTARRGHVSVEVLPAAFLEKAYAFKNGGQGWRLPEILVPVPIYWLQQKDVFTPLQDLGVLKADLPYTPELGIVPPGSDQQSLGGVFVE